MGISLKSCFKKEVYSHKNVKLKFQMNSLKRLMQMMVLVEDLLYTYFIQIKNILAYNSDFLQWKQYKEHQPNNMVK